MTSLNKVVSQIQFTGLFLWGGSFTIYCLNIDNENSSLEILKSIVENLNNDFWISRNGFDDYYKSIFGYLKTRWMLDIHILSFRYRKFRRILDIHNSIYVSISKIQILIDNKNNKIYILDPS